MKSRLSYFLISGIIVALVFTGIFIWRINNLKEIAQPNENSYTTPISSKYIPKNADLIFHWKINPNILPNYIENFQRKGNKNITNKTTRLIRDSSLKLISLDFERDISKWAGEYGSFALFDSNHSLRDWLMVLEINNDLNPEEALETILSKKKYDQSNESINKLNISESKIFSRKIKSNQSIYFSIDKDYILIASNPKLIKSSINNLEINTLSTKEKYKTIKLKENLKDGILLLEMSPNKIFNLIGQEKDLYELNKANKLISSINFDNKNLNIEGILSFDIKKENIGNGLLHDLDNQEKQFKAFNDYILIDNPRQYFGKNSSHPFQKSLASIIQKSITTDYSNILKIILENTSGNLIWLKDKEWLALTNKSDTNKKEINNILNKDKFLNSYLDFKDKNLEVWSKITTINKEKIELKESIEVIIQEDEDVYIWSQNLSSISNFENKEYIANSINSANSKEAINDFDYIIKIHLGKEKTKVFLNGFYPYLLLRTMLGNKLYFPNNINISVAKPTINYPDFVKFKINLKTS